MTHDRWTSGDAELTRALRALYAPPSEESYWNALEARILAHVARDEGSAWWAEMADMVRPGLVAAAALILAATLAMVHSQQLEARNAYASVISSTPTATDGSSPAAATGDGDEAIHYLLSR